MVVVSEASAATTRIRVDPSRTLSATMVDEVTMVGEGGALGGGPAPVVVLWLAGGHAAADAWPGPAAASTIEAWEHALRRIERLPAITVGVLDGRCGAAALELLLTADYRMATRGASVSLPAPGEAWPGMLLHRFVQQCGLIAARRVILLGGDADAEALTACDAVDRVSQDPAGEIDAIVARAAGVDGRDVALRRQLLFDAVTVDFEEALGTHLAACDRVLRRAAGTGR
ncbi:enoyl-CoA-hydratase DpgB [Mangrovihabitans endophyticus]|uniref:(3,5-dihydroxycyclohex-3-enyl)acetyl-CoA dehydratase subunit B n=1 Tax=Mangrovihabitans endophyticus TaxID=1751298 RepID=A0A8J3BY50_9ACTN|nr:enoyl-CoA-hydratase DpgB [Mangrovihabitans endophyticus]GGK90956.1 hypothetical protein GCM10012284_25960 [Mangrovihabitans endophyticus]